MRFKTERIGVEWNSGQVNPLLHAIVLKAADRAAQRWNWDFVLTCIYRSPDENDALYGSSGRHRTGVHVLWRAVDIRTRDADPSAVLDITTYINDRYEYDPGREGMHVALPEGGGMLGSTAAHLHLQVSPETRLRSEA